MSQVLTTTRRGLLLGAASTALLASTQSSLMRAATAQSRDALVTTETVVNFADHASPGYVRLGLQFTKGEIPSGSTPQLARNGAAIAGVQFDERVSWSDGSLKNCVCHIRDAEWSGNESRSYQVTAVPGGYDNVGTKTLRDITSTHDFSVVFSNVKDHQDAAYGSGTFLAKFNIQSAKSTRVYKYHSGPVCESWEVWGMATDAADGMPDAHLKTIWYVSVWKDDHGAVADYEFGAVVALDWWDKTNLGPNARPKSALSYIAELKDGAKTINTYELGSVVSTHSYHPYQSQWMTVRTDDDDNHARRYWVTQIPTLMRNFDKRHAISTGFFPPLDTSWSPRSNVELRYTANYTPCGGVNHRTDINATGGYVGRGLLPNMDCITFMSQTAQNLRSSRTSAFAGLHIPYHFKSSHSRTIAAGPQAGTDLANTVIAMKMQNLSPPALYDFTAGGMPAAMYAYTNNLTPVTYDPPKGGIGVWSSVQSRPSHAVAYSYFMYLIEGERHFMQANLELATNAVHQQSGNQYGGEPYYTFHGEEPYQSIFKIPATRYGAICCVADDNNRATGWGIMLTTYAAAVCPDADVQSRFIRLLQKNQTLFVYNDLKYMPQGMKDIGWYGAGLGMSPFSGAIQVQGVATAVRLAEDANALSMLNSCFQNEPLGAFTPGQFYRSDIYRASFALKTSQRWDPVSNPYVASADVLALYDLPATIIDGVTTYKTMALLPGSTNGDVLYPCGFTNGNDGPPTQPIPWPLIEGRPVYAVNVNGDQHRGYTFNISSTYPAVNLIDITQDITSGTYDPASGLVTLTFTHAVPFLNNVSGAGPSIGVTGITGTGSFASCNGAFRPSDGTTSTKAVYQIARGLEMTIDGGKFYVAANGWNCQPQQWNQPVQTSPPLIDTGDTYSTMHWAALVVAYKAGATNITEKKLAEVSAFLAPVSWDRPGWYTWKMAP